MSTARTLRRRNARRNGRPRCPSCEEMHRIKPDVFPRRRMVYTRNGWRCPSCKRPEKPSTPTTDDEGSNE